MDIWAAVTSMVKPVTDVIDAVHTSDEERLNIEARLLELKDKIVEREIKLREKELEAQAKIITAEAQGASWLQRNWRPITMITFLVLVVADTFGLTEYRLSAESWALLQLGIGGYVVGRSAEKITQVVKG